MTRKSLTKKLDKKFSLWVRNQGSVNGFNQCYTCNATKEIGDLQCGHFVSRRFLATRWEPKNCRPQCVRCNVFSEGDKPQFALNLLKEDPNILEWLNVKKNNRVKMTDFEMGVLIAKYETA